MMSNINSTRRHNDHQYGYVPSFAQPNEHAEQLEV